MSARLDSSSTPLFIDTGALYARFKPDDRHHEQALTVFEAIQSGELPYRPLYTTNHVLSELASLALHHVGYDKTTGALTQILTSEAITVIHPDASVFADAYAAFKQYDDQAITLVDHMTAVLAREYETEYVCAFNSDFATLGLTRVPVDTGEPH